MRLRAPRPLQAAVFAVVLLALGATSVAVGRRATGTSPVSSARLADRAHDKVAAQAPQPAIDQRSPVTAVYHQYGAIYLGTLTLWLACAGSGRITLVVLGSPSSESLLPHPYEMARASVDCTDDPVPVRAAISSAEEMTSLTFGLADSAGAVGRAGFAYRVTSSTGAPLSSLDQAADPTWALHLTSEAGYGEELDNVRAGVPETSSAPLHGRYKLAVACAGTGTIYGTVKGQSFKLKCQWPPKRTDFPLAAINDPAATITIDYRSAEAAPVRVAMQFIPG